ncbi:hypothetical protein Bca52824_058354 [Brassica carinata]|uniref:Uncharacterized protein n=1 Tax=Brassica carinata TaxID=52824 RepID=A0A8X7QZ83_BRACI|nr:hypothetical protein Bca52824_058354 [Brassica carinata]
MRGKSDPALGSSLISDMGLSRVAVESTPPAAEGARLSPVGPLSVIGVEEVAGWREKYEIPDDVDIRVLESLEISPGQLNPPSWSALIAMQNLGDLEGLVIGVAEVLYSYSISPLNDGEGRYHLHPHNRELPVREISKNERKRHRVFDSRWTEKFAFMHLPGFSPVWRLAGGL